MVHVNDNLKQNLLLLYQNIKITFLFGLLSKLNKITVMNIVKVCKGVTFCRNFLKTVTKKPPLVSQRNTMFIKLE